MAHIPLPFDLSLVGKAADALRKHQKIKNKKTKVSSLFGEEPFYLHLMVTFEKIPPKPSPYPQILATPHSIHENIDVDVCFLAKKFSKPAKDTFAATNLPIKKVRSLKKLAYKNNTVELQKKFAAGFDIFMVDKDEAENVPRFAGKFFQKKGKIPLPVELDSKKPAEFKANFEKVRDSAHIVLSNGNTACFKIANSSMENDKIKDNVISALEDLVKQFYKKKMWSAFRTISLKATDSISLPLFERLPSIVSKYNESTLIKRPRSAIESKSSSSSDEVVDSTNKDLAVLNPKKKSAIFTAEAKAQSDDEFDDYEDYPSGSEEEDDDEDDDEDEEDDEEESEEEVPAPVVVVQTPSKGKKGEAVVKKATPGKVVVSAAETPQKKAQTQPKRPATPAPAAFKTPQPAKAAPSTPSKVTGSQSASRPAPKKVAAAAPSTPSRKPVRK
eukprot:CAMPEP_0184334580 /NCGR_PEP_ID=MMETSP1089-20130417/3319_1 /TAXON_ID=38269 ORGANISM="Gloeochaete wittrockiana, Strain SAG46.84" /NCGR_SAMPLE_ID=MMETSP1089 /ASSEMBLY_ACC=CAM_ASM_000445 /LENGTH=442 /DNA_ID=CAMNT_0026658885 /DNA_START=47 /DNA_END=1375 /DNA_ORIENTATION=-